MRFLFQDILTFTGKNVNLQTDYLLLKSIIKVFYLFKVKSLFDCDEISEVCIQCTCCIIFFIFRFMTSKVVISQRIVLPVFIKAAAFYHVFILWMK